MSRTRDQLEEYIRELEINADSVIDIGGAQRPISERAGVFNVKNYKIFDLPNPHETKRQPDYTGDLNKPVSIVELENRFDVAFCYEVFDYIYDPMMAILNIADMLKPGGTLYISFPFVYPVHNPAQQDMLRYTEFGARKLLEEGGFEVEDLYYRNADRENIEGFYLEEGMRAARGYDHHDAVTFNFIAKKK